MDPVSGTADPEGPSAPPSLLRPTFLRSITASRLYLAVGLGYSIVFEIVLTLVSADSFTATGPLLLPIFAVVGSMGALTVFTNDRMKGVYEYLVAYGVSPRNIFLDVLESSLLLATLMLSVSLSAGLSAYLLSGHVISVALAVALLLYAIPMGLASTAFAATVGMFWTSLSSPRTGMNSPIGLIPLIGVAPSALTLIAVGALAGSPAQGYVIVAAVGAIVLIAVGLATQVGRLMPLERLLSPA